MQDFFTHAVRRLRSIWTVKTNVLKRPAFEDCGGFFGQPAITKHVREPEHGCRRSWLDFTLLAMLLLCTAGAYAQRVFINDKFPIEGPNGPVLSPPHVEQTNECSKQGMLTGIGGGIARDILVAEIPTVLRAQLYAVAALAGVELDAQQMRS